MAGSLPPAAPLEPPRRFASFFQKALDVVVNKDSLIKQVKFINGTLTMEYEDEEFAKLVVPHRLCLVRKFSYGRQKMDEIHNEFKKIAVIFSMAMALGKPLNVDTLTLNMTRPSVARFCLEVDLTKELEKSVKIWKKGHKHELIFTFEHVPFYCKKCCKIGHKEVHCRVGKPPQKNRDDGQKVEVARKNDDSDPKKKGIKIPRAKPRWKQQPKGGEDRAEKLDLEVEILQTNPLIVKSMELQDPSLHPAETLALRVLASSSEAVGSMKVVASMQPSNRFSTLQNLDDDDAALREDFDDVEVVFSEENADLSQRPQEMLPEVDLQQMSLTPKLVMEKSRDDSFTKNTREEEDEDETEEEFYWSEGEMDDAHVERSEIGEIITVKRKRGRKSKEERAKMNEGEDFAWGGTRRTGWHSGSFRFQNMLWRRVDFLNVVKEDWNKPSNSFGMLGFSLKLHRLKVKLKEWNKVVFGNVFDNLNAVEKHVQELEMKPIKKERMDLDYLCDRELVQESYDQDDKNVINFGFKPKELIHSCHQFVRSVAQGEGLGGYLNSWWLSGNFKIAIRNIKKVLPSFIVWELWKARNKFLFEEVDSTVPSIIRAVKEQLDDMMLVHMLEARNVIERDFLQRNFPKTTFGLKRKRVRAVSLERQHKYVLNTDGSFKLLSVGYGFVIQGEKGFFVYDEAGFLGRADSLQVEVYGLLIGVRKCENLDLFQSKIQTDNQFLANILALGGPFPWSFYYEVEEIHAIMERQG
ncbi:OLC1v1016508C1 [Oldenlandia corymbosa var. corymbosa]|uniref:OLC1v1016508C1 n=1 Tax=Oldenlandia corymbosa var. corymbosa TaxID=529605 RepID=A0AAV1E7H2_OLDCO|nr:OLC1v1016508C1 [Oldenlandia corymbosa var. corymbosa]